MTLDTRKRGLTLLSEACGELVRRKRARWRNHAEDVVQDACLRALQLISPFTVRNPDRYLARIARNLLIDHGRRRKREVALFDSSVNVGVAAYEVLDPERVVAGQLALVRALAVIDDLPPRCREAFVLHRFEDLKYVDIARRMRISTSMVEKHIAQAMLRLAPAVEPP